MVKLNDGTNESLSLERANQIIAEHMGNGAFMAIEKFVIHHGLTLRKETLQDFISALTLEYDEDKSKVFPFDKSYRKCLENLSDEFGGALAVLAQAGDEESLGKLAAHIGIGETLEFLEPRSVQVIDILRNLEAVYNKQDKS